MRLAVLSDIHGNLEALTAVYKDIALQGVDRVICLGDYIGYGPDADPVLDFVREKGFDAILGNHEFALNDIRGRRWMNFLAAENNEATEKLLSDKNKRYCKTLPAYLELEGAHFVHGYPKDNVFRYLYRQSDASVATLFDTYEATLFFVGHTHRLQVITRDGGEVIRQGLGQGKMRLQKSLKYIFNCGSVGQPRDGNNHAKYLVWDSGSEEVDVRFVDYDYSLTMDKIKARGFPLVYALRLR